MRKRRLFPGPSTTLRTGLSLLVVLLAACAPAETSSKSPEVVTATPIIVELTVTSIADFTATPAPTLQAVATSRGPNLEATDPTTISLASGGVQFVEFFRFT